MEEWIFHVFVKENMKVQEGMIGSCQLR